MAGAGALLLVVCDDPLEDVGVLLFVVCDVPFEGVGALLLGGGDGPFEGVGALLLGGGDGPFEGAGALLLGGCAPAHFKLLKTSMTKTAGRKRLLCLVGNICGSACLTTLSSVENCSAAPSCPRCAQSTSHKKVITDPTLTSARSNGGMTVIHFIFLFHSFFEGPNRPPL